MQVINEIRRKVQELKCNWISNKQLDCMKNATAGCLTIFHDYEGKYARKDVSEISYKAVNNFLDIEKEYGINATYNIVGKLIADVPDVVKRIKDEGHELASHSFKHDLMSHLSKTEIYEDINQTQLLYDSIGIKLEGFRSPQSKWNFKQMKILMENGIKWNAEVDMSPYPYILLRKNNIFLVRMPVKTDDWGFESQNVSPGKMFDQLKQVVGNVIDKKSYASIGFHPWVEGIDIQRMKLFEKFVNYVVQQDIKIMTFGKMYRFYLQKMFATN